MASTRQWRRGAGIRRNQTYSPRERFLAEVRDSLPRAALGARSAWEANGRAIDGSQQADTLLRAHGFDRWGQPEHGRSPA